MHVNEEHYHAGFVAGCDGLTDAANPHPRGTGMHHAWQSGWEQGRYASAFRRAQQHADAVQAAHDAGVRAVGFGIAVVFVLVLILPFLGWLLSFFW